MAPALYLQGAAANVQEEGNLLGDGRQECFPSGHILNTVHKSHS